MRLAVLNFFAIFWPHLFLNFENINVNYVGKTALFPMLCLLEKSFLLVLLFLRHCKIEKAKERTFSFKPELKKFGLSAQCAIAFYSLRIVVILLVNARKSLKSHHFESVQNSVFFFDLKFILLRLFLVLCFVAEAGIVLNFL